jgi:hypothetical protein
MKYVQILCQKLKVYFLKNILLFLALQEVSKNSLRWLKNKFVRTLSVSIPWETSFLHLPLKIFKQCSCMSQKYSFCDGSAGNDL